MSAPQASEAPSEAMLARLDLRIARRLEGLLQGDHKSPFRGSGLDLADLREYQFHDDVRRIDWNVTARTQVPHVREYIEDREVTAWFLLDMSPSVDFESVSVSKRAVLTEFTAMMCRFLARRGNRAGALLFSGGVEQRIPARGGRRQTHVILDAMNRYRASRPTPTNLYRALSETAQVLGPRALVFVVSDFISPAGWEQALNRLAMRHDVVAVRLTDPFEVRMPNLGLITFQDSETGEQLFIDTHDPGFRRRFAAAAEAREEELRATFDRAGVDALELSTEYDVADAVLRFADMRKHRARMNAGAAP